MIPGLEPETDSYGKAVPLTGHEGPLGLRRRGSHILQIIGSQMVVRLSLLGAGRPLPTPCTHFCQRLSRP
jgi:hypothetical protein